MLAAVEDGNFDVIALLLGERDNFLHGFPVAQKFYSRIWIA